jgi:hypothetical protein
MQEEFHGKNLKSHISAPREKRSRFTAEITESAEKKAERK